MIYCHKVKTMRSSVTKIGLEYLNKKNHENIQNSFKIWLEPFHITSILSMHPSSMAAQAPDILKQLAHEVQVKRVI